MICNDEVMILAWVYLFLLISGRCIMVDAHIYYGKFSVVLTSKGCLLTT